jgi:hypothetical protein
MTAKIHVLPGIERADLLQTLPSQTVLEGTLEQGIDNVIVIGTKRNGDAYLASGIGNKHEVIARLFEAATWLSNMRIDHEYED